VGVLSQTLGKECMHRSVHVQVCKLCKICVKAGFAHCLECAQRRSCSDGALLIVMAAFRMAALGPCLQNVQLYRTGAAFS
jgi:hypothetical protein